MGKTTLWRAGHRRGGGARAARAPGVAGRERDGAQLRRPRRPPRPGARRGAGAAACRTAAALSRALVLEDVEGPRPDPHAVGVALSTRCERSRANASVVVAVDDVQWLDARPSGALAYAARRLRDERVGVLLVAPLAAGERALLDELRRSLPADASATLEVGPARYRARCTASCTTTSVSRFLAPLLAEVHQASGGNPFYALEIVRMLQRSDSSVEAGQPLPVPESLHDLVHGRLLALPAESRGFLACSFSACAPDGHDHGGGIGSRTRLPD